jgi:thiol-disulfide isomerase/thioredoxin
MKRHFAVLCLMVCLAAAAMGQGIEFFHGTWSEALAKAKSEEKLIFVDAYASWCGPCKRMAAQTFTQPKAGEFYNSNFICMKIDMEKPENSDFASKYTVASYPTLMYIDAEGKVVLKEVGFKEVDPLLELGKKALGKMSNSQSYERQYNEGNRDPQLVFNYVKSLNRSGQPSLKITNEYLNTQKDLSTEFNLRFIHEGAVECDSRVFDLLLKYRPQITALVGEEQVRVKLEAACRNTVKKALELKNLALLKEAKDKMKVAVPDRALHFGNDSDMRYYAAIRDIDQYLKSAKNFQKTEIKSNASLLNDLVITLLRNFPEEPKVLKQAEKWAGEVAKKTGMPEHYLTWADIYNRMGNKEKARATANKAKEFVGENDNGMKAKIDYFLQMIG